MLLPPSYLLPALLVARHCRSAAASGRSKWVVGVVAGGAALAYLVWPAAAVPAVVVLTGVGVYVLLYWEVETRPPS